MNTRLLKLSLLVLLGCFMANAEPVTHSAKLTWADTNNPAGTSYNVQRTAGLCTGTPTYSTIATALTAKTYVDATVTPGNYCYVVTATFSGVTSSPSNTASAAVPTFAPINLAVTVQ